MCFGKFVSDQKLSYPPPAHLILPLQLALKFGGLPGCLYRFPESLRDGGGSGWKHRRRGAFAGERGDQVEKVEQCADPCRQIWWSTHHARVFLVYVCYQHSSARSVLTVPAMPRRPVLSWREQIPKARMPTHQLNRCRQRSRHPRRRLRRQP